MANGEPKALTQEEMERRVREARPMTQEEMQRKVTGVAAPSGPAVSPGVRLNVAQTQHPKIADTERFIIEALSSGDTEQLKKFYKEKKGLDVAEQDGQIVVRDKGVGDDVQWQVADPNGYLHLGVMGGLLEGKKDVNELGAGVLRGIGEAMSAQGGARLGAQLGARLGPKGAMAGGLIGAGLGGAAAGAGLELGGQQIAKMYGIQEEYDPLMLALSGVGGAAPLVGEGVAAAGKAARQVFKKRLNKKAAEIVPKTIDAPFKTKMTSMMSGIPTDTIEYTKKYPRRFLKFEQDPNLRLAKGEEVGQMMLDMAHRERENIGDQIGDIHKRSIDSGVMLDLGGKKKMINDEIAKVVSKRKGKLTAKEIEYVERLKKLKEDTFNLYSPEKGEGGEQILMGQLPDSANANDVVDAIKEVESNINWAQTFSREADSAAKRGAAADLERFAKKLRRSMKADLHSLDPNYQQLDIAYGVARQGVKTMEKHLVGPDGRIDPQKAADAIRSLERETKLQFSSIVQKLADPAEIDKINRTALDIKSQIYLRNPNLNALSTGGATSTSASGAAKEVGNALGAMAGAYTKAGYAAIVAARHAGGAAMQYAYSPMKIRRSIDTKLQQRAQRRLIKEQMRKHFKKTLYGTSTIAPKLVEDRTKVKEEK